MKMKQKYALILAAGLPLMAALSAAAQTKRLSKQELEHILVAAEEDSTEAKQTLSGINLRPTKQGSFQLDFSQELDEDAMLQIRNTAGKLVYQKPVSIAGNRSAWRYNVGKLKPDTYLVEVKTSDTTYWTKFRVSR